MVPESLSQFSTQATPVLDDGHILLIDVLGSEQAIVDAARISFGIGTSRRSQDVHLLRYLMRGRHTSPFEMCEIVLRVRVPMDCWRQWIRHRTASVNEYSTRYSEAIDAAQKTHPNEWRTQATDNKQGSAEPITEWPGELLHLKGTFQAESPGDYLSRREAEVQKLAREVYEERRAFGVSREVARKDLPLSTYTEAYWKCDLHNLLHFLELRLDRHAQQEIRAYAQVIADIVKVWLPNVWKAFEDYRLYAITFSRMEKEGLQSILHRLLYEGFDRDKLIKSAVDTSGLPPGREAKEFETKLKQLLVL